MLVLIFTSKLPRELGRFFKKKLYHMSVPMNVKPILVLVLKLGWRCPMRTWDWTDSPFSPAPRLLRLAEPSCHQ